MKKTAFLLILLISVSFLAAAGTWDNFSLNSGEGPITVNPNIELGFIGVLYHTIQFGQDGTSFDYVKDGGQNNLFFYQRLTMDVKIKERHSLVFLYQPLDVSSEVITTKDVKIEDKVFVSGTPMSLRYGFDFYRFSYLYDVLKRKDQELSFGVSMQIRNATIDFASQDGEIFVSNRNIGPVPVLKMRYIQPINDLFWFGTEIDGFYASNKFINGSLEDSFTGSIIDASIRGGYRISSLADAYLNIRYIAGGAEGTETDENEDGDGDDGYTKNVLHTIALSLGIKVR